MRSGPNFGRSTDRDSRPRDRVVDASRRPFFRVSKTMGQASRYSQ